MRRPDPKVLSALASLTNSTEFAAYVEWVTASLHDELETLVNADASKVQRHQGYCQALTEVLQHTLQARESLRKTGRTTAF